MKKSIILSLFINAYLLFGQTPSVGIGTKSPTETLDVRGDTYTNTLYLRNPGDATETGGKFVGTSVNALEIVDPTTGNSGIFNYLTLRLNKVPGTGISDYDTKIDASNFLLVLHNYELSVNSNGSTFIGIDYNLSDTQQGSPEFITFISGGTWHITARFKDSTLKYISGTTLLNDTFNYTLYMIAYRLNVTKANIPDQTLDLVGTDGNGQTLPIPSGF
jgi:hypothetical protein